MQAYISLFLTGAGVLIGLTNAVVQLLKSIVPESFPTNLLAVIVAEVLTVAVYVLYIFTAGLLLQWYSILGALVAGLLVAYGAMFGYDKLMEIIKK